MKLDSGIWNDLGERGKASIYLGGSDRPKSLESRIAEKLQLVQNIWIPLKEGTGRLVCGCLRSQKSSGEERRQLPARSQILRTVLGRGAPECDSQLFDLLDEREEDVGVRDVLEEGC